MNETLKYPRNYNLQPINIGYSIDFKQNKTN